MSVDASGAQSNRRFGVGVLYPRIEGAFSSAVVAALAEAFRTRGVRVLCFTCGKPSAALASSALLIQTLANAEILDGAIVASSKSFSPDEFLALHPSLPAVSLGKRVSGVPSVWVQNGAGIRALFEHLVRTCGRKRIAFVRGAIGNAEAEARYGAYLDLCVEHSLPQDPELVEVGDFTEASGAEATERLLLKNRTKMPDAVMAANDLMAMGVLRTLASRGVRVPQDVAVVGFDDLEAAQARPPLTTARQPIVENCQRAADLLLRRIAGENVALESIVPPKLIVRQSCGAPAELIMPSVSAPPTGVFLDEPAPSLRAEQLGSLRMELAALQQSDSHAGRRAGALMSALEREGERKSLHASQLEEALARTREQALARARAAASDAKSLEAFLERWVELLPAFAIDRFYLVRTVGPVSASVPERAKLLLAYGGGKVERLSATGVAFPTKQLLPAELQIPSEYGTWLVLPLTADEQAVGYVVLHGELYDLDLITDLSAVVTSALLRLLSA
jgi:LacI family transcriptional regulator